MMIKRVAEIDRAALAVRQPTVIEHLEQHVEDIRMRLLDLIEKHDLIGTPTHCFGERPALLIADISGRRADQAGDRVLLHVFRHVDAHHGRLVVEEEGGERLGELGLADAGRPKEHERADRAMRILQAGARPSHGGRHGRDRLVLPDDALADGFFHLEELLALALEHLFDGHARPARHDRRDMIGRHRLFHRGAALAVGAALGFDRGEFLLEPGDDAIAELAGALIFALALRLFELATRLVEIFLEFLGAVELVLLALPFGGERGRSLLEIGELLVEANSRSFEPGSLSFFSASCSIFRRTISRSTESSSSGFEFDLHAQARRGLVDEVDRLVGQEAVRDVTVRQRRGGDEGRILDAHAVVQLVFLLEAAQDRDGVLDRRLGDENRLEAPRQRRILLDVLAIFVERGRADAMQFAARQRRLQKVRRIHRAIRLAGADEGMHLVDEQDDAAFGARHLLQHGFQALLELAAIFRAGDERAQVEREQELVLEALRHIAIDDA